MELCVNDRKVEVSDADGTTLAALLDSLRRRGEIGPDEVVIGLEVDSLCWRPHDMDRLETTRTDEVQHVAIATESLRAYCRRILVAAVGMAQVLDEAARRIAAELRSGCIEKANADLYNLLTALQRLLACACHVRNTCGLRRGLADGEASAMGLLASALQAAQDCQERADWPALADALEDQLSRAMKALAQDLEQMRQGL